MEKRNMVDLLGDPVPEIPAMTDPLPWRVFRMNDYEWWVARTLEEAKADYQQTVGPMPEDEAFDDPGELTDAELDRLKFIEDPEVPPTKWVRRTFREELERISKSEFDKKPGMFACTEY
jgi:hypothetical protein